jgi:hypothetical protein
VASPWSDSGPNGEFRAGPYAEMGVSAEERTNVMACGSHFDVPARARSHAGMPEQRRKGGFQTRPNNEPPYPYNVLTQIPSSVRKTAALSRRDGRRSGRPKASSR